VWDRVCVLGCLAWGVCGVWCSVVSDCLGCACGGGAVVFGGVVGVLFWLCVGVGMDGCLCSGWVCGVRIEVVGCVGFFPGVLGRGWL